LVLFVSPERVQSDGLSAKRLGIDFKEVKKLRKSIVAFFRTVEIEGDLQIRRDSKFDDTRVTYTARSGRMLLTVNRASLGEFVGVVHPDYSYIAQRAAEKPDYEFTVYGADRESTVNKCARSWCQAIDAYYDCLGTDVFQLMSEDSFHIISTQMVVHDGESLLHVDWSSPIAESGSDQRYREGYFVFAPEEGWMIREFLVSFREDRSITHHRVIQYQKSDSGLLVPHTITMYRNGEDSPDEKWVTQAIRLAPMLEDSAIQPSAFGLPTISPAKPGPGRFVPVLLFVIGAVCLLSSRVARRKKRIGGASNGI